MNTFAQKTASYYFNLNSKMKRLVILTLLLFATIICNSQNSTDRIDSFINKIGKEKKNTYRERVGNNRNGSAFFYLTKTHKTFSIIERKTIPATGKRIDSISWTWYFFIDETLVKISYYNKAIHDSSFHVADLYFDNSVLVEKREFKKTPIPPILELLNKADILYTKSKELARKRY